MSIEPWFEQGKWFARNGPARLGPFETRAAAAYEARRISERVDALREQLRAVQRLHSDTDGLPASDGKD